MANYTDPAHYKGMWQAAHQPSVIPGWASSTDQEKSADYVDQNGELWTVEAYNPTDSAFPTDADWHWHATIANTDNRYGLDATLPTISGSASQFQSVAAIDVWVADWNKKHATVTPAAPSGGGGAVFWLIVLVAFAFTEKKRR